MLTPQHCQLGTKRQDTHHTSGYHLRLPSQICVRRQVASSSTAAMASASTSALRVGQCRNLHWVFKVGDRSATAEFYTKLMGMEVLRHEEFSEGCEASCNGPYNGKWSKTMIGYGDEDTHFVLELTYNYGLKSYQLGNDYSHITVKSKAVYTRLKEQGLGQPVANSSSTLRVCAPDGYAYEVYDGDAPGPCPITDICLHTADLERALGFWQGFLGFTSERVGPSEALLHCGPGQTALRLRALPQGVSMERGTAYGRIAFACSGSTLQQLERDVPAAGYSVHTPYVSLDTPGKASVQVVILQDPDGHEICFVGDEGFRDLSARDPQGAALLAEAMQQDGSAAWFEQRAELEAKWASEASS